MKHAGILSALLATAALMCAMPGLLRFEPDMGRVDERLRPAQLRTLTVWFMPGETGDRKLISQLCAAFEKEREGVRVFLRVVTAEEFTAEGAVLPDAALFETGDIAIPEQVFVPLVHELGSSGSFAGVQRAAPLWLAPNVLSVPADWLDRPAEQTVRPDSLLAAATAEPRQESTGVLAPQDVPWGMLMQPGALKNPSGVGWQQLLASCPGELRAELTAAVQGGGQGASAPAPSAEGWSTSLPVSRGASPTPMPSIDMPARVETLAQHQARRKQGEALAACVLSPAVSDRVRYLALCRDSEDARAFWQFLMENRRNAAAFGLIAPGLCSEAPDALTQALEQSFQSSAVLPNAFAHTRQELESLCADGFARCEDPVQTLLRLR